MDSIIITSIAMLISVFAIFKIANFLGMRLGFWPVLFCAVCALSIEFVLPVFTHSAGSFRTILFLSIIVLSATFVTYWNEKTFAGETVAEGAQSAGMPECAAMLAPQTIENRVAEDRSAAEGESLPPYMPIALPHCKQESLKPNPTKQMPRLPALIHPTIDELIRNEMSLTATRDAREAVSRLKSLDAILDYACEQKNQTAYSSALFAFKHALDLYRHDDYAPFITIEIGNIYKNTGLYDEAIVIYNRAFCLRAVMASHELKREFQHMIYYLHILKETLHKYNSFKTPFDQIPKCILQEVEIEFQFWLSQKYAS